MGVNQLSLLTSLFVPLKCAVSHAIIVSRYQTHPFLIIIDEFTSQCVCVRSLSTVKNLTIFSISICFHFSSDFHSPLKLFISFNTITVKKVYGQTKKISCVLIGVACSPFLSFSPKLLAIIFLIDNRNTKKCC